MVLASDSATESSAEPSAEVELSTPPAPEIPAELKAKFEAAQKELRGDRREVVVLFADLKGFTSMSEQLDPEEVSVIMQRVLGELADAVHRYEGYVDKYIGDAIMALFGAPLAHENNAERAALAALDMLEAVARFEDANHPLSLRVGLNLGEVVAAHLGDESRLQYTVMGDTVNVASRLEGAAEPDTILVSHSVYERIASRFETEELEPITVKGKAQPLQVHRVLSYGRSPGSVSSRETPFVGREEELRLVEEFLDSFSRDEGGHLLIEGEAGAGKSRLISEALDRTSVEFVRSDVAFTQIHLPGQLPPDATLFRDLVSALERQHGASGQEVLEQLLGDTADEHSSGLAGLVRRAFPGTMLASDTDETKDARTMRQNRWLALAAILEALSRERPVLVVVENLHWADEEGKELLNFLLSVLKSRSMGSILTTRAAGESDGLESEAKTLRLGPLEEGPARSILGDLVDTLRPRVRREIIRRSQGNPLYLEELARSLMEGVEADSLSVPGSVQGLLKSRVDRLEGPAQLLLQMAAVLGPRFPIALLKKMYALETEPTVFDDALDVLKRQDFVTISEGSEDEGRFLHALMQEVVYSGILLRLRKVLHESAARLGEEFYADRIESEAPFLAHHFWEADLRESAAPHLFRAAMDAAREYELHAAERWFGRLTETIEEYPDVLPRDRDRADTMLRYGAVLLDRGDYDAADEQFRHLIRFGNEAHDDGWVARALRYRAAIAGLRGELDDARELYAEGLERVPPSEKKTEADLLKGLGLVLYYAADDTRAMETLQAALHLYEELADPLGEATCYINIGNVQDDLLARRDEAERTYRRALELIERVGDRRLKTGVLLNIGTLALGRGDWKNALARFHEIEALAEKTGWLFMRFLSLQNQAACELSMGELRKAVQHLETCLREGESMLKAPDRVKIRVLQCQVFMCALDHDRAARKLEEAKRVAEEIGSGDLQDVLLIDEGRLRVAEGDWKAAGDAFAEALAASVALNHSKNEVVARAHLRRAAVHSDREEVEPPAMDSILEGPTRVLLRYLEADAAAVGNPNAEIGRELEETGEAAAEMEWTALERSAFERAASVWAAVGDGESEKGALERASRAMRRLADAMPPELREGFVSHPRNARLLERLPV